MNIAQKQNLFSSDDSGGTDISFNSSFDSENAQDEEEDYHDKVSQLKEQVTKLFLQNPAIKNTIDFNEVEKNSDGEPIPAETEG